MKVVLASSERFSGGLIEALSKQGHEICCVISPSMGIYDRGSFSPRFWTHQLRGWDVRNLCQKQNIHFRVSRLLEDGSLTSLFRTIKPDVLLLFGWPTMVKQQTLDLFTHGGMNIHPSLLPKLRGADPLFDLVDLGDEQAGVTFHKVVDELDAGPIYYSQKIPLSGLGSYDDLYLRVLDESYRALPKALHALEKNPEGTNQTGTPTFVRKFKQEFRALDLKRNFNEVRRRTLACYSHHTRLTSCKGHLIHFRKVGLKLHFETSIKRPNTIQAIGMRQLVITLGNEPIALYRVQIDNHPWWMTPILLRRYFKIGDLLGNFEETLALMKQKPQYTDV